MEGDASARWRSAPVLTASQGARESGTVILEIDPGCCLEPHRDSAEEIIIVLAGEATLVVGDKRRTLATGGVGLIRADARHEVRNQGRETLRFAAIYARPEVLTRYERQVQPDGRRERDPLG